MYRILLLALLVGCSFRGQVMTIQGFQEVHVGMSEQTLVKMYGPPLNSYHRDNGVVIYEYIERFQTGATKQTIVEARRYYFTIKDGKVISKQMTIHNQPAYEPMMDLQPYQY